MASKRKVTLLKEGLHLHRTPELGVGKWSYWWYIVDHKGTVVATSSGNYNSKKAALQNFIATVNVICHVHTGSILLIDYCLPVVQETTYYY